MQGQLSARKRCRDMFDEMEFEKLVETHGSALYRYCLVGLNFDNHLADEVYNDCLLLLFEKWDKVDRSKGIRTWLYRSADNLIRRVLKRKGRDNKRFSSLDDLTEAQLDSVTDEYFSVKTIPPDSLGRIIKSLPLELREPFRLRFVEKLSLQETAQRMGMAYSTLRLRLAKAEELARKEISNIFNQ